MDLLDLWRPDRDLSWRKLKVLLEQLPPESAFATQVRLNTDGDGGEGNPEAEQWSRLEHLVAAVADRIQQLEIRYAQINFKGKPPKFEPIPRPGVSSNTRKKRPAKLDKAQTEALFAHLRATQGEA